MILETKIKQVNLVIKTRSIIQIADILGTKNFETGFIKAYNECNVETLAKILAIIGEDTKGEKAFNTTDEVYDFLDNLRAEKKMTSYEVYSKISEVLNEDGFFKKKMTKDELKEMMSNPLSEIDINAIFKKVMENMAEKQISQSNQA